MDHLNIDFECKFSDDSAKAGHFTGYGAIFGNTDSYGDVIAHGAFKDNLREWEQKGKFPPMLLQHGGGMFGGGVDDNLPVGKWNSMEENSKGLKVSGYLFAMQTDRAQLLYEGMKAGELDGLSIGYRVKERIEGTKPTEPRRTLKKVDLVEVSIVTFPANDKARIGNVKMATTEEIDAINSLSDAEDFLREAGRIGFSKKMATDFVGRLVKISRREAGGDQNVNGLLEQMRSVRESIR